MERYPEEVEEGRKMNETGGRLGYMHVLLPLLPCIQPGVRYVGRIEDKEHTYILARRREVLKRRITC